MKLIRLFLLTLLSGVLFSCNSAGQQKGTTGVKIDSSGKKAVAAFAEGCFWCSEHIFEELAGVDSAVSGYAGGHTKNPTYDEVCSEKTGHAETVLVYYNPGVISYSDLLDVFFSSHDPTTLNRQGPDVGTSYRSAIFYTSEEQKRLASEAIKKWTPAFKNLIVTEVSPLKTFYRAEEYHQNYTKENPYDSYVRNVSVPRFESFKRECKLKLKKE
ncbi:peptide-methionine (S)-S-oxide reductase MsrA [Pararcticibacter amylolyticus]|uniref:Peptide methionine sulfoxide reductase MsrA n=1 Tax=Pararcticibacter amylolyticus TaxID=2173175 RepID=A0A2U2PJ33_9SPHI|nr:peptide-methionine (S)-S-oxide reductase MsrA [Pararcticibacter amylolyticus]PWG81169.1 peptide-methionine (S)-S-oxide reductase [Pararcticibacter amylolyticus]